MLDAGFLQAEDADRHVSLAIGAVAVLAGPMPDFGSLAAGLAERILSVPRFRQVLRTQPLDLGAPRWEDAANLDIAHHVRLPALTLNPIDWMASAWRTSRGVTTAATQVLQGAVEIAAGLLRPAAASSLTGPVTNMRRYATVEVSLEDVTRISDRFDVTINDVALAAITDSFRTMLMRRGEQPQPNSLRTLVPVSVRSLDADDKTDNRVSVMLPCLPVDKADPISQLRAVHARLTRAKASGQRQAGNIFVSAANAIPFPFTAWTVRALTRLPQRGVVALATNVPGPRKRLRVMGREVIRLLPIPPLALQLRTGIAIMSYADHLAFGIIGDYDAAPDVDELANGIERAIARLTAVSAGHWRSTPVGTLALVQGG